MSTVSGILLGTGPTTVNFTPKPFLSGAYTVGRETDIGVMQCRYAVISGSDETSEEWS